MGNVASINSAEILTLARNQSKYWETLAKDSQKECRQLQIRIDVLELQITEQLKVDTGTTS